MILDMKKTVMIFSMVCLLALIPIQAEALEADKKYVYISGTMFVLFTTNEVGFELIDGGLLIDGDWKIFNTEKVRMFGFDTNLSMMFAAGSFETTHDQVVLSMKIDNSDNGIVTIYVYERAVKEMTKYQNEGHIYELFG